MEEVRLRPTYILTTQGIEETGRLRLTRRMPSRRQFIVTLAGGLALSRTVARAAVSPTPFRGKLIFQNSPLNCPLLDIVQLTLSLVDEAGLRGPAIMTVEKPAGVVAMAEKIAGAAFGPDWKLAAAFKVIRDGRMYENQPGFVLPSVGLESDAPFTLRAQPVGTLLTGTLKVRVIGKSNTTKLLEVAVR